MTGELRFIHQGSSAGSVLGFLLVLGGSGFLRLGLLGGLFALGGGLGLALGGLFFRLGRFLAFFVLGGRLFLAAVNLLTWVDEELTARMST